ncbi:peptidyl-prolyl cis-trans isomerase SurA [Klenkia marina]|uniref:Peptidyl-prolyl cis-trans isomerase SurA n=1 Tax=Klenkia marina TaxID=1960309 RepID=A0A1G4XBS6_9ACTN|nr:SurA N-terminal domain-containing protein [Klenkia marina]SCX38607.1 peptidyl-prolyl cis-trans isomerase SurA [Klenkia marina]
MRRRPLVSLLSLGMAGVAGLAGLAGCRTSPDVAVYVGEERVTVEQVRDAVDDGLADPDVAGYAAGLDDGAYTRQVLDLLIGERVYDAVEARYDVEVTPAQVEDRLEQLFDGQDADQVFAQLAQQQGLLPDDAREIVRQLLVREEVAEAEGLADLSDDGLQAAYEQARSAGRQFDFGYITVPDQATADAVVAQLRADPASYDALAAQYAGTYTVAPRLTTVDELPQVLAAPVQTVLPEGVFSLPVAETGGVVVGQVRFPAFEDLRADLDRQVRQAASQAAQPLVQDVEDGLDVTLNPRYGALEDGSVVADDGGVVRILDDAAAAAAATGAAAGD